MLSALSGEIATFPHNLSSPCCYMFLKWKAGFVTLCYKESSDFISLSNSRMCVESSRVQYVRRPYSSTSLRAIIRRDEKKLLTVELIMDLNLAISCFPVSASIAFFGFHSSPMSPICYHFIYGGSRIAIVYF